MPFKKGKSGNPGGRPKETADVKDLARTHTKEAVERLVFWMRSDNAKASVSASSTLLDRAWGRAPQDVNLGAQSSLADLLREIDGRTRGIPKSD